MDLDLSLDISWLIATNLSDIGDVLRWAACCRSNAGLFECSIFQGVVDYYKQRYSFKTLTPYQVFENACIDHQPTFVQRAKAKMKDRHIYSVSLNHIDVFPARSELLEALRYYWKDEVRNVVEWGLLVHELSPFIAPKLPIEGDPLLTRALLHGYGGTLDRGAYIPKLISCFHHPEKLPTLHDIAKDFSSHQIAAFYQTATHIAIHLEMWAVVKTLLITVFNIVDDAHIDRYEYQIAKVISRSKNPSFEFIDHETILYFGHERITLLLFYACFDNPELIELSHDVRDRIAEVYLPDDIPWNWLDIAVHVHKRDDLPIDDRFLDVLRTYVHRGFYDEAQELIFRALTEDSELLLPILVILVRQRANDLFRATAEWAEENIIDFYLIDGSYLMSAAIDVNSVTMLRTIIDIFAPPKIDDNVYLHVSLEGNLDVITELAQYYSVYNRGIVVEHLIIGGHIEALRHVLLKCSNKAYREHIEEITSPHNQWLGPDRVWLGLLIDEVKKARKTERSHKLEEWTCGSLKRRRK